MESLTPKTLDLMDQGRPFARALILSHQGSTPRTPGSTMLVTQDGEIFGTIGGGKLEGLAITACQGLIPTGKSRIHTFDLGLATGPSITSSGTGEDPLGQDLDMICGGSLTLLMEVITPGLKEVFHTREQMEISGTPGVRIVKLHQCSQGPFTATSTLFPLSEMPGELPWELTRHLTRKNLTAPRLVSLGLAEYIVEPIRPLDTLYILGGGHVGHCLYQVAVLADFQVMVIDDREKFANPQRFPHARCRVVPEFKDLAHHMGPMGAGAYVVILTRGHRFDLTALDQVLALQAGAPAPLPYIGMIGSRTKRNRIYQILADKGVNPGVLKQVHSPVGLPIGAETPAEIAVSIMGEILQVRAGC